MKYIDKLNINGDTKFVRVYNRKANWTDGKSVPGAPVPSEVTVPLDLTGKIPADCIDTAVQPDSYKVATYHRDPDETTNRAVLDRASVMPSERLDEDEHVALPIDPNTWTQNEDGAWLLPINRLPPFRVDRMRAFRASGNNVPTTLPYKDFTVKQYLDYFLGINTDTDHEGNPINIYHRITNLANEQGIMPSNRTALLEGVSSLLCAPIVTDSFVLMCVRSSASGIPRVIYGTLSDVATGALNYKEIDYLTAWSVLKAGAGEIAGIARDSVAIAHYGETTPFLQATAKIDNKQVTTIVYTGEMYANSPLYYLSFNDNTSCIVCGVQAGATFSIAHSPIVSKYYAVQGAECVMRNGSKAELRDWAQALSATPKYSLSLNVSLSADQVAADMFSDSTLHKYTYILTATSQFAAYSHRTKQGNTFNLTARVWISNASWIYLRVVRATNDNHWLLCWTSHGIGVIKTTVSSANGITAVTVLAESVFAHPYPDKLFAAAYLSTTSRHASCLVQRNVYGTSNYDYLFTLLFPINLSSKARILYVTQPVPRADAPDAEWADFATHIRNAINTPDETQAGPRLWPCVYDTVAGGQYIIPSDGRVSYPYIDTATGKLSAPSQKLSEDNSCLLPNTSTNTTQCTVRGVTFCKDGDEAGKLVMNTYGLPMIDVNEEDL